MRTIVADCVGLFFGDGEETKYFGGIRKNVLDRGRCGTCSV